MAIINGMSTTSTSTWRKEKVQIGANELLEHVFNNTNPNTYYVQNSGGSALLIGIEEIPTVNSYEWKCNQNDSIAFGRPLGSNRLFIQNLSSLAVNVTIWSYDSETFDPIINKNTLINIANAEVTTDGIIKGFQTGVELPSGDNTIGNVGLTGTNATEIVSALSGIDSNTDNILIDTTVIKNKLTSGLIIDSSTPLNVHTDIADKLTIVESVLETLETVEATISTSTNYTKTCNKIIYFVNDGENDISLTIGGVTITVKSGEVLNDIKLDFTGFTVEPKVALESVSFRFLGGVQ